MNCGYSEEYFALFIEGELRSTEMHDVELHIASCNSCREVTVALRQSQDFIRTLRSDSLNSSVLANMHVSVMNQLANRRRPPEWWIHTERALFLGFRWKYALAGAASLVLVCGIALGILWKVHKPPINTAQTQTVDAPTLSPAISILPVPRGTPVNRAAPTAPARRVAQAPQAKQHTAMTNDYPHTTMVKLFTDDPGVVIYWTLDGNGETQ